MKGGDTGQCNQAQRSHAEATKWYRLTAPAPYAANLLVLPPLAAEMTSFCDQLIRLATHQPAKGRTMSARKEFSHLVRSMPLQ